MYVDMTRHASTMATDLTATGASSFTTLPENLKIFARDTRLTEAESAGTIQENVEPKQHHRRERTILLRQC